MDVKRVLQQHASRMFLRLADVLRALGDRLSDPERDTKPENVPAQDPLTPEAQELLFVERDIARAKQGLDALTRLRGELPSTVGRRIVRGA